MFAKASAMALASREAPWSSTRALIFWKMKMLALPSSIWAKIGLPSLKIDATIDNARAYLALREKQTLASFLWGLLDGRPLVNRFDEHRQVPPQTEASVRLSKALKKEGFRFVGPTTLYAFMQSVGMVNDHVVTCHRHAACAKLQKAFEAPVR